MPYQIETLAIHAGQEPDAATGAVMTPIFQTSTYAQDAVGQHCTDIGQAAQDDQQERPGQGKAGCSPG
jgi:O-acetylhomoserine/O-acetylserine sulfhydrylase-like pyridoxal-dependent enzyme